MMSRSIYSTGNHFGSPIWQKLLYQESCIQITQTLAHAPQEWLGCCFLHYNKAAFHQIVFSCCFELADSIDPLITFKDI